MTKSDRNGLEIRLFELKRLKPESEADRISIERNTTHVEESLDDLEQYAPKPAPIGVAWLLAIAVICLFWLWAIS